MGRVAHARHRRVRERDCAHGGAHGRHRCPQHEHERGQRHGDREWRAERGEEKEAQRIFARTEVCAQQRVAQLRLRRQPVDGAIERRRARLPGQQRHRPDDQE